MIRNSGSTYNFYVMWDMFITHISSNEEWRISWHTQSIEITRNIAYLNVTKEIVYQITKYMLAAGLSFKNRVATHRDCGGNCIMV